MKKIITLLCIMASLLTANANEFKFNSEAIKGEIAVWTNLFETANECRIDFSKLPSELLQHKDKNMEQVESILQLIEVAETKQFEDTSFQKELDEIDSIVANINLQKDVFKEYVEFLNSDVDPKFLKLNVDAVNADEPIKKMHLKAFNVTVLDQPSSSSNIPRKFGSMVKYEYDSVPHPVYFLSDRLYQVGGKVRSNMRGGRR